MYQLYHNLNQDCVALIDFLCAALTRTNANALSVLLIATPTPPLADQDLPTHCCRILERDFPMLSTAQSHVQQNQIATQLGVFIQDQRNEALLAEQR